MDKLNINNDDFIINDGYLEAVLKNEKRIVIPDGVEVIGGLAFDVSKKIDGVDRYFDRGLIEEVELPDSIEKIETIAFRHCNLKEIKLPKNLKFIGRLAFATNENLERIELYDDIEEIESYAFTTKTKAVSKLFQNHSYDKNHYIIDVPSEFVINYTSYEKLDKLLELMKNSGSFGSETYKFKMFFVPKFEFTLVGPSLSKSDSLKIYKKLIMMKCKKVNFVNNDNVLELPGINDDGVLIQEDTIDKDNIIDNTELLVDEKKDGNDLDNSGKSR